MKPPVVRSAGQSRALSVVEARSRFKVGPATMGLAVFSLEGKRSTARFSLQ